MEQREFLDGFAIGAKLNEAEAGEQWAAHSRQLSDPEIREIEAGGYESGLREGVGYLKMYPMDGREEDE